MKHLDIALLAAATAFAAGPARAETSVRVGVHFGGPSYRPAPPMVVYSPPPIAVYAPAHGYWNEIVVKTWVPGRLVTTHDRWGRIVRINEPGYFTYRTDRVWVACHNAARPSEHAGSHSFDHRSGRWGR